MFRVEDGVRKINGSCSETHKRIPICITVGERFKKRTLTYLFCTKCNEINKSCSDVQKYNCYKKYIYNLKFSCPGSHKRLWIQCMIRNG